jgi:hypothetical protein
MTWPGTCTVTRDAAGALTVVQADDDICVSAELLVAAATGTVDGITYVDGVLTIDVAPPLRYRVGDFIRTYTAVGYAASRLP